MPVGDKIILLHNSHWANNIGNAFFTLGVKYILEQTCVNSRVIQTDQLASLAWQQPLGLINCNSLKYAAYSEPDWFVIAGPLFKRKFIEKYSPVLRRVLKHNKKTRLIILNAGSIAYDEAEADAGKRFLEEFCPYILTTRDEYTYSKFGDFAEHCHNGIDTAFFCSDYYPGYETPKLKDYITVAFDTSPEPDIELGAYSRDDPDTWNHVSLGTPAKRCYRYSRWLNWARMFPRYVGDFKVIRPSHKIQGESPIVLFGRPNSFVSQTPYGYLNLYHNTNLTISDRVHACVATLAYGNPARLVSNTKRRALFERLRLEKVEEEIVRADMSKLRKEKERYLGFMQQAAVSFFRDN